MTQATEQTTELPHKPIRSDVWQGDKMATLLSIQAYLRELAQAADVSREPYLRYLIEMAHLEASDRIREIHAGSIGGDAESPKLEIVR